MSGVTRKVRRPVDGVCSACVSGGGALRARIPSLLTFHPTRKHLHSATRRLYVAGVRVLLRVRDKGACRDPRNTFRHRFLARPSALLPGTSACAESVHEILRVRSLPQGASFTTKLRTYADSGPSGTAMPGARREDDTLTHILFSARRHGPRKAATAGASSSGREAVMSVSLNPRAPGQLTSHLRRRPIFSLFRWKFSMKISPEPEISVRSRGTIEGEIQRTVI